ncbi:MAG: ABC transporter substrate-binding protein, partial [Anaerolineales bacterium]
MNLGFRGGERGNGVGQVLELHTLGGLQVKLGDKIVPELGTTKAQVLLVYLCMQQRPLAREILAEIFWEDRAPDRALSNLRVALAALRKSLNEYLLIEHDTVRINPAAEVWIDAVELEASLDAAQAADRLAAATELYQGAFLEGIYLRGAREAEAWLGREREHLQRLIVSALSDLIDAHLQQEDFAAGIQFAERLLALDPLNEGAHRGMMALLVGSGQRAAALAQYEVCREVLREELGVEPDSQTTMLFRQIQAGDLPMEQKSTKVQPIKAELPQFLLDAAERDALEPVFVGRQAELARLSGGLEHSLNGSGGVLFIIGGPGRGKTSLLRAFAHRAQETHPDLLVVQGTCNAFAGAGDPYLPFRQALAMLCGDVETRWRVGEVSTEGARRLWEAMPETAQALLGQGKSVLQLLVDGGSLAGRLKVAGNGNTHLARQVEACLSGSQAETGQANQAALQEQTCAVLRAVAARHPLLLLIDDLQWGDWASLNLLFHLGRGIAGTRLLILGAYRPEEVQSVSSAGEPHPLAALLPELKRQYGDIWLDLSAIEERESRAFVRAYLETEPHDLTEAFKEELFQHTEGHPLFTVELLRDLQERGDLVQDARGAWVQGSALDWSQLPPRVEGVIEARLSRLEAGLKQTLEIASVEGEQFTLQVLAQILEVPERTLLTQLNRQLDQKHRLVRSMGSTQVDGQRLNSFQFRHALYQQHLEQALPESERELLHAEVGQALEVLYANHLEAAAPQLARHFCAGGQGSKAVPYLQLAGDQALGMYAHQEAGEFYRQAVEVLTAAGRLQEAASTLLKLGQAYHIAFDYQGSREAYERAFDLRRQVEVNSARIPPAQQPLRMVGAEPVRVNYGWLDESWSAWYPNQLFMGLIDPNYAEYPSPGLARAWQISPDGCRYTFHLRQDAVWSDGQPVRAEDFAFAWKLRLDPEQSPYNYKQRSQYEALFAIIGAQEFCQGLETDPETVAVRAIDDFILEVELEKPNSVFLQSLKGMAFLPMPRQCVLRYGPAWSESGKMISNGPFIMEDWQPGKSIRLRRNPQYGGEFPGNLETVEINLVQDVRSQQVLAMYTRNELDCVELGRETFTQRHDYPGEYIQKEHSAVFFLGVNCLRPLMGDRRVRRALALAIDKKELADQAYRDWVSPASGGFVPPGIPGHAPGIGLPFDPDRARDLLAQAGFPEGRNFPTLKILILINHLATGEYLQKQWADILQVSSKIIVIRDWDAQYRLSGESDMTWSGYESIENKDPDEFLGKFTVGKDWDHFGYFQTLAKARQCQDQQARLKLYQQADRLLIDEAVIIPLTYGMYH